MRSAAPPRSAAGLALLLLLLGCAADEAQDTLRGSVSRVYPLGHDGVRARLSERELAVQYVEGAEVVVQVVVRLDEVALDGPTTVDLTAHGEVLGRRGEVRLPDFVRGALRLNAYAPQHGAKIAGDFDAVVSTGSEELTVVGRFEASLEDLRE